LAIIANICISNYSGIIYRIVKITCKIFLILYFTQHLDFIKKFALKILFLVINHYANNRELAMVNPGYADLETKDGIFLEKFRDMFDIMRIQLYHYVFIIFG